MTHPQPGSSAGRPVVKPPGAGPPAYTSAELLAGGKELVIHHGDDVYRLKLTGNNKLILTK